MFTAHVTTRRYAPARQNGPREARGCPGGYWISRSAQNARETESRLLLSVAVLVLESLAKARIPCV